MRTRKQGGKMRGIGFLILTVASFVWVLRAWSVQAPESHVPPVTLVAHADYRVVSHQAVALYPKGTVFPQGSAAYFYKTDPGIAYTPRFVLNGLGTGDVWGKIRTTVQIATLNDDGKTYWSKVVSRHEERAVRRGNVVVAKPVEVRPATLYPVIQDMNRELNSMGNKSMVLVESELQMQTNVQGVAARVAVSQTLPITLDTTKFTMPRSDAIVATRTLAHAEDGAGVFVPVHARLPLAVTLFFFLLACLEFVRHWYTHPELRFRRWITPGSVQVQPSYVIPIAELKGLVDLAIDLNQRVIYDASRNTYAVYTGPYMYRYSGS